MNQKEFKSLDEVEFLDFRELERVSGGRALSEAELRDAEGISRKCAVKKKSLKKKGQYHEAKEFEKKYFELYSEWLKDIDDASDDSPDILFSSYIEQYL